MAGGLMAENTISVAYDPQWSNRGLRVQARREPDPYMVNGELTEWAATALPSIIENVKAKGLGRSKSDLAREVVLRLQRIGQERANG